MNLTDGNVSMATILYGRVSTVEQTSEHQLSQATAAGFKIDDAVFDNGTSGVSTRLVERRPAAVR